METFTRRDWHVLGSHFLERILGLSVMVYFSLIVQLEKKKRNLQFLVVKGFLIRWSIVVMMKDLLLSSMITTKQMEIMCLLQLLMMNLVTLQMIC
uniref:At4g28260 n=1 Tax=Arabidopsis thaliana TaxID=3702 RepID=Q8L786_ARATH|nr:putative protein [Arabidopsis thaliana]AAP21321.1 At4g28260 [Arabidopsis thaliana]